ncbi:MAG: LuxR C-terminal-related transcriptional regulator [Piscinibacter sp.]
MQAQTFAPAKIQPPLVRTHLVARPELLRRLRDALAQARLTLLCAPAGFGKTVALTQAVRSFQAGEARVAWVSADEEDDLHRFLACLCAALDPLDLPWRRAPEALLATLHEGSERRAQAADELLTALAAAEVSRGLLVIDDLHRIEDPAVFELLEALVAGLPPSWSIVIGTRVEPPLPLLRWRAAGEVAEFRQGDLRFSADDVQALVDAAARPVVWSAQALLQRTAGWPAGLRLSLNSSGTAGAERAAQATTQRHLFDYLAAEVLDDVPSGLRDFLLRCSVLPELTVARCEAVSGDARAARWMEEIERRGLFATVLDGDETTLRLHDLFRDFLEDRLRRAHPDEFNDLLVRAAGQESDVMRRVNLLMRAGAWAQAEGALVAAVPALLLAGGHATVIRLVEQFPAEQRERSPRLAFARGLCAWPRFEWITMQRSMERAARGFEDAGHADLARQAGVLETVGLIAIGRIAEAAQRLDAVRAQPLDRDTETLSELMMYWRTGATGPALGPARHLERMTDLLEGRGSADAGMAAPTQWYRSAPHFMFVGRAGVRAPMQRFVRAALHVAGEHHAPLRAAANALQAWLLLWQGRADEAHRLMLEVRDDERWLGQPRSLRIPILAFSMAWHTLRGEAAAMREAAQAMIDDVDSDPERRASWRGVYLYNLGRMSAALGDDEGLRQAVDQLAATPPTGEWPYMRGARLAIQGLAALREGRLDDARERLESALVDSAEIDTLSLDTTVRMALAGVHLRRGDARSAWTVLAPVVRQAREAGEPVGLLVTGRAACAAMAAAPAPAEFALEREWLANLLAERAAPTAVVLLREAEATPAVATPLTDREQEVLACIAAGDSNKLIARALELSPHTVKRHVANILAKLALDSRGQAAAWHRERFPAATRP